MELVPSDFLKHSVQLSLKRFFREVATVRGSALPAELSLRTPELCATHLTDLFRKLAMELSDHPSMVMREAHFRIREIRRLDTASAAKTPTKKEAAGNKNEKPAVAFVTPGDENPGHALGIWETSWVPSTRTAAPTPANTGTTVLSGTWR